MTAPHPPLLDEPAEVRVARGAALLDARLPGWWRSLDTDVLDVVDPCRCVLGQCFGSFLRGMRALDVTDPVVWAFHPVRTVAMGGTATEDEAFADGGRLTEAWALAVAERRAAAGRFGWAQGLAGRGR